jgi:eukaryotic-like serine/threonine-protein kinase
MIGTTFGKYRIIEKLGRGGMGTVYKAVDNTLDRDVAIKVLNPELTDADVLKRFRAEAVTLARLNHPGIATIFELHHQEDEVVMVMEFVRGETFHDLSDRLGQMAPPQAAHLCMQVLDALAHAHRAGVVHRDLKPANLMITEGGVVKVMDFGIARVLGSEHFTHGGYMMGTPAYMAPEQVLGREIDGRADLYSVGVVFYRLLSGRLPFNADTAISMVQMQISEAPTPIQTFRPDLPTWCTAIIDRALAKSASDRFQSAEEFRSALLSAVTPQALGELPTLSTPTPPGMALEPDVTMPHGTPTPNRQSGLVSASAIRGMAAAPAATANPPAVAPAPTPTETYVSTPDRATTTVVLGRTHLAALAAVLVILLTGVALLAFAALRRGATPPQTQTAAAPAPTPVPAPPSAALTPASSPQEAPVPQPSSPAPPAALPPATSRGTTPTTGAAAAAQPSASGERVAATAGASEPGTKPTRGTSASGTAAGVPAPDLAAGRGGRGAAGKDTVPASSPTSAPPAVPPPTTPAAPRSAEPAVPAMVFNQVRVLVSDAGKARERTGVLQLGDRYLGLLENANGRAIQSVPYSTLTRVFYARSKQPKWRDASGQEVVSRIDLGPLGFFRGDRNWVILLTQGEPIIFRIEDSALKSVLPALQQRTGLTIQR